LLWGQCLATNGGKEAHVKKKTDAKQVEQEKKAPAAKKRGRKQVAEMLAAPEAGSDSAAETAGGAS